MIGAHPDDEDTELLTVLVRGMGAETAYLSLNRGEGGQNLIGPELGEALGLDPHRGAAGGPPPRRRAAVLHPGLRFRLLEDARRDLGALAPRHGSQGRRADRAPVPPAGHRLGIQRHAARRPRPASGGRVGGDGGVSGGGGFDPVSRARERGGARALDPAQALPQHAVRHRRDHHGLSRAARSIAPAGLSYHQIAMAGRSLHRSQDMGQLQTLGPSRVRLALVEDRTGARCRRLVRRARHRCHPAPDPSRAPADADAASLLALRRAWAAAGVPADELAHLDRATFAAVGRRVRRARATTTASSPDSGSRWCSSAGTRATPPTPSGLRLRVAAGVAADSGAATPAARARRAGRPPGDRRASGTTRRSRRPTSGSAPASRRCMTGAPPRPPCGASPSARRSSRRISCSTAPRWRAVR